MAGTTDGRLRLRCSGDVDPRWKNLMPDMTAEDLAEHLERLEEASQEDLDELLHDLLVRAYPTKATQDS